MNVHFDFAVGSTIVAVSYAVGADDEERLQLGKIPSEILTQWEEGNLIFPPIEKGKVFPFPFPTVRCLYTKDCAVNKEVT